jgi:hypothetical protein
MNLFAPYLDYLLLYICESCETVVKLYVLFVEMHGLRKKQKKNEKFLPTAKKLHEFVPWEPADQPRNALCPLREETHCKRPGFAVYLAHNTHQRLVSLSCARSTRHPTKGGVFAVCQANATHDKGAAPMALGCFRAQC